ALASQDFVDALVLAAASIAKQLPDLCRIVDGLGRALSDLCRRALDDQRGHRGGIPCRNGGRQPILLLRSQQGGLWRGGRGRFRRKSFLGLRRSRGGRRLAKAR